MEKKKIGGALSKLDKKFNNKLIPKEIKITSVIEVTFEIESEYRDFSRIVRDFYLNDGVFIGRVDPLNQFDAILFDWSMITFIEM